MLVDDLRPCGASQLFLGLSEKQHDVCGVGESHRDAGPHIVDDSQHANLRGGQNVATTRLVVEADVAAGHRHAQGQAAVHQALDGLDELPHHFGVLRRPEVEAVGDRDRLGAADGHVPVVL